MRALVLSSGGVDSTTCLGMAVDKYGKENVVSLSVFYGHQPAAGLPGDRIRTAEFRIYSADRSTGSDDACPVGGAEK